MKIEIGYPPNYEIICEHFPVKNKLGVIYCWGDIIFNPDNIEITDALYAHETVHSGQQKNQSIEDWWLEYISSASKRLAYELPAHIVEYKVYSERFKDRNDRNRYLVACARRLSSSMYGNMISFPNAMRELKYA